MITGRAPLLLLVLAAGAAAPADGQALRTQPQRYLLTAEPHDGRALWVQPAAMARRRESSIEASVTASRDGATSLEQYGLTMASNGLAFGWQRSRLLDGSAVSQYALGAGFGGPRASLGVTRRWIRGERVRDGAFDLGARAAPSPRLELSLAWRDLGSPVLRRPAGAVSSPDTVYRSRLIPAASVALLGSRLRLGGDWELETYGWRSSAIRLGALVRLPFDLGLAARAEFSPRLARRELAVSLTWNGEGARIAGFEAVPSSGPVRSAGVWAGAVRDLERRSRRGRR